MILEAINLKKYYNDINNTVKAVDGISLSVSEGEFIAIMGESGSGKTTLLNCLATMDSPDSGEVFINGIKADTSKEKVIREIRRKHIGFIFQEYNLLENLTVEENISLALSINQYPYKEIQKKVSEVSQELGIADIMKKYPFEISGGQKQRCACARAMINKPAIIFADEPTGALDSKSSILLLELLKEMNDKWHTTILMVTHNIIAASYTGKVLFLKDGKIKDQAVYQNNGYQNYRETIYRSMMEM